MINNKGENQGEMKGQKEKRNEKKHKIEGKWRGIHSERLGKEGQVMTSEGKVKETLEHVSEREPRSYDQCIKKRKNKED